MLLSLVVLSLDFKFCFSVTTVILFILVLIIILYCSMKPVTISFEQALRKFMEGSAIGMLNQINFSPL